MPVTNYFFKIRANELPEGVKDRDRMENVVCAVLALHCAMQDLSETRIVLKDGVKESNLVQKLQKAALQVSPMSSSGAPLELTGQHVVSPWGFRNIEIGKELM